MIGQKISHYRIVEKLGEGGMGVVYRAEDLVLKRSVALKFLSSEALGDETEKARFLREAQAAAALDHPNICTVYEVGEDAGRTFLAMAYLEGETLQEKIAKGPLRLNEALDWTVQILEGLQEAHEEEIFHRDIKPSNVMVTKKGRAKILDFGLARLPGAARITQLGTTLGTAAYMSPQQAEGIEVDHRSDLWSAGVVCYEMLSGTLPFSGEYIPALMYSIVHEQPAPLAGVEERYREDLDKIFAKALAKDPAGRYQQAGELIADLAEFRRKHGLGDPSRVGISAFSEDAVARPMAADSSVSQAARASEVGGEVTGQSLGGRMAPTIATAAITAAVVGLGLWWVQRQEPVSGGGTAPSVTVAQVEETLPPATDAPSPETPNTTFSAAERSVPPPVAAPAPEPAAPRPAEAQPVEASPAEQFPADGAAAAREGAGPRFRDAERVFGLIDSRSAQDLATARRMLEQASRTAPDAPKVHGNLAKVYALQAWLGYVKPNSVLPLADQSAGKALELNEAVPSAHLAKGIVEALFRWDWEAAETSFARASELTPDRVDSHEFQAAAVLIPLERFDQAEQELRRALELDSSHLGARTLLARLLVLRDQPRRALEEYNEVITIEGSHAAAYSGRGFAYAQLGELGMARADMRTAVEMAQGTPYAMAGMLYVEARLSAKPGRRGKGSRLKELLRRRGQGPGGRRGAAGKRGSYVSPYWRALGAVGMRDTPYALSSLEAAVNEHDPMVTWLNVTPEMIPLRGSPRFQALLKKMNLAR